MNKYLVVRFSSFGDIAQAMPVAQKIRENDPNSEIHWLTRADFHEFVKSSPAVDRIWELNRASGFAGLKKVVEELKKENFTHVYDAHANLRSLFVSVSLLFHNFKIRFIRRSKERLKRILLFWFRVNLFPKPYRGVASYLNPLRRWFSDITLPLPLELNLDKTPIDLPLLYPLNKAIVLAPSATWELKRWPTEYWIQLIKECPDRHFILLGGETDTFCHEIAAAGGSKVLNLVGRLSWLQSVKIISLARALVSGDTGLLHAADVMGRPTIALIGPTAFGFPSRSSSTVAAVELYCRPCTKDGRGACKNSEYKKCLRDVTPQRIAHLLKALPS